MANGSGSDVAYNNNLYGWTPPPAAAPPPPPPGPVLTPKQVKAQKKTMNILKRDVLPKLGRLAPGRSPDYYHFVLNVLKDMQEYFPTDEELAPLLTEIDNTLVELYKDEDGTRDEKIRDGVELALDPEIYNEIVKVFKDNIKDKNLTLRFSSPSTIRNFYANREPANVGFYGPNRPVNLEREIGPIPRIPANELQRQNMNWRHQYAQEQYQRRLQQWQGVARNIVPSPTSLNQAKARAVIAEHAAKANQAAFNAMPRVANGMDPAIDRKEHLRVAPAKGALKRPPGGAGAAAPRKTRRSSRRSSRT